MYIILMYTIYYYFILIYKAIIYQINMLDLIRKRYLFFYDKDDLIVNSFIKC